MGIKGGVWLIPYFGYLNKQILKYRKADRIQNCSYLLTINGEWRYNRIEESANTCNELVNF